MGTLEYTEADVLIALNNFNVLGIQRVVTSLVNNWPSSEQIAISVHQRGGPLEANIKEDIPIYELDEIAPPRRKLSPIYRVLAYHRLLRNVQPDVVLSTNQFENLALCMAKRFNDDISIILPEHNHVTSELQNTSSVEGWFGYYYRQFFAREYKTYADGIIAVSEGVADDLVKNHSIPRELVKVIYNPVDINEVRTAASEPADHEWLNPGNNTVISVSRHIPQKGLDILLRSWADTVDRLKNELQPSPKLIITSYGPEQEKLESLVTKLGIEDSVQFVGFVDNIWAMVNSARAFINTSRWEGLPVSIIEAQALETPVIVSDCPGGSREIVLNGEAGFLFEDEDEAACTNTLIQALTDKQLCEQKVKSATENLDRFAAEKAARHYINYINKVRD